MGQGSSASATLENEPTDTASEESPPFGVLLIGNSGSGKTNLLKNLLGKQEYKPENQLACLSSVDVNVADVPRPVKVYDKVEVCDDADHDEEYLQAIQTLLRNDRIDVVILCVKMEKIQISHIALFQRYDEIGVDWEKAVIALTFTDCLCVPNKETRTPSQISEYFNGAMAEWKLRLQKVLSDRVYVRQEVVERIPVYPTTCYHDVALGNREQWVAPIWSAVVNMLQCDMASSTLEAPQQLCSGTVSLELHKDSLSFGEPVKHYTSSTTLESPLEEPQSGTVSLKLQEGSSGNFGEEVKQCNSSAMLETSQMEFSGSNTSSDNYAKLWQTVDQIFSEVQKPCPIFGILVIGETGSGKSTLINNLLGKEVACIGHTMQPETSTVTFHELTVEGVGLSVYDTPGLDHSMDNEHEFRDLRIMQDILARGKIHLVIYCFRMTETKMRRGFIHAVQEYRKIGLPWQHTIMALTFADCVPDFDTHLPAMQEMLRAALQTRAHLKPDVIENLKICPTIGHLDQPLPNREPWFTTFGQEVIAILSKYTELVAT